MATGLWWIDLMPNNGNYVVDNVENMIESTDERKINETSVRGTTNKWKWFLNIGGGIAGALGGWKLGENFGPVGKIVGCVGLGILGTKLGKITQEVGTDIAAAQDYSREAEKKGVKGTFWKALGNNLMDFNGQSFDGANGSEITVDEPEM